MKAGDVAGYLAIRGDDDDATLLARERFQSLLHAPPERMLGLLADRSAELMSRAARLLAVGESVGPADPLLSEQRERGHAATRADMLEVSRAMKRAGALRRGLSAKRAADIMYAIVASESVYLRLVDQRGWSTPAYARMLERALVGALSAWMVNRGQVADVCDGGESGLDQPRWRAGWAHNPHGTHSGRPSREADRGRDTERQATQPAIVVAVRDGTCAERRKPRRSAGLQGLHQRFDQGAMRS